MNILIRLDCSASIGMGHLMRCLSFANALREAGARIVFVIRELKFNRMEDLKKKGFEVYSLITNPHWDKTSWISDKDETIRMIEKLGIHFDWIVVDHYGLDAKWEVCLRPYANKIMVMDDLADRPHDCDLLLDQNIYHDQLTRYLNLVPNDATLLLGPDYALLRPDFKQYRAIAKKRESVRKILICFGGGDSGNETIKAIQACHKLNRPDIEIDVVVSSACSRQNEIAAICRDTPNARYLCQIDNIAQLMAHADLAIGAGGILSWERCCSGLPSIVIIVADNQLALTKELSLLGVLKYLGEADQVSEEQLADAVLSLINHPNVLSDMSVKARHLVDGRGCEKVVSQVLECQVCE